ncbi:MAG: alpha-mannosidase [Phycisphaerales bacterium]
MPMPAERRLESLEKWGAEVIVPARIGGRVALQASAAVVGPDGGEARAGARLGALRFRRVRVGFEWGPAWATCWFRLRGEMPRAWRGQRGVALRFDSGTEALLRIKGEPFHGFDANRDTAALPRALTRRGRVDLLVEAACNHPLGTAPLDGKSSEAQQRWAGAKPGRFFAAELVLIDEQADRLADLWAVSTALARELLLPPPPITTHSAKFPANVPWQDGRCEELLAALEATRARLGLASAQGVRAGAADAVKRLEAVLGREPAASVTLAHAVGHAHIDTAWLWPVRETRRKIQRTFSNVLRLMERWPAFRFLCSQAQQYAFLREDAPGLFREVQGRVREGRWEPGGGMWVEPDCSVPSVESLIRQVLHADRAWREWFGPRGAQRHLYLPDTFGFPAHLPQVMRHCGLLTFITNKLSWNDTNAFPHTTFRWRGNDGSEVLAHCTPIQDYNQTNSARELRRGEANHRTRALFAHEGAGAGAAHRGARFLAPFGFGDGGGGPTKRMILSAQLAAACDGLPRVRQTTAAEFCAALHADVKRAGLAGVDVPLWTGELYLELHRGTLTSQQWLKRGMVEAERALRGAEAAAVSSLAFDSTARAAGRRRAHRAVMDELERTVLLNQFHDILPGTSIGPVYEDARRDLRRVMAGARAEREKQSVRGRTLPPPMGIVHALPESAGRSSPVLAQGQGGRRVRLENDAVWFEVDGLGQVTGCGLAGGQVPLESPLNTLMLYEDRPRRWDAWDIDESHALCPLPQQARALSWRLARTPARASVTVERRIGVASRIRQQLVLSRGSRRLEVMTRVDWREEHALLRALFPTGLRAERAAFDTGGGVIERPTHRNTSWEQAAFEVPGHRFTALGDAGGTGLAVLNQAHFGHSCHGGTIGLSLLRSPRSPDPTCDTGIHRFAYAIMPYAGDWRSAGVAREAEAFCGDALPAEGVLGSIRLSPGAGLRVLATKFAADGGAGVVVRLLETHGVESEAVITWSRQPRRIRLVDGLERPLGSGGLRHRGDVTRLPLRGFGIVSVLVEFV